MGISIIVIIIVVGETHYRIQKKQNLKKLTRINELTNDDILRECDLHNLSIELGKTSLVPLNTLAMRGSWRIALNQVWNQSIFEEVKKNEYRKRI